MAISMSMLLTRRASTGQFASRSSAFTWRRTRKAPPPGVTPGASTVPITHSSTTTARGVPLIEIVTKTIEGTGALAPEVGKAYVTQLRELVRSLNVSDVRMEQRFASL